MADIGRYRVEDRRPLEALYRRVFGAEAADLNRLRWDWQYRHNPAHPDGHPLIWVAREGTSVVGQLAAMPVVLTVRGHEIPAAWGIDAMVAPERRQQGLGELLLRRLDAGIGATLGLMGPGSPTPLIRRLRWPVVTVPCLAKPLSRRALRMPNWSVTANRLLSACTLPFVKIVGRSRPLVAETRRIHHFDEEFTALWDRIAGRFDFAVRRDAAYLNWKYIAQPDVRYSVAALRRGKLSAGYIVYRHTHEPLGRVTLITDFLVEPGDDTGLQTLLGWVDREARAADSDKIRCHTLHGGYRRQFRRAGYFPVGSSVDLAVKINAIHAPPTYYEQTDRWHLTLGDGDRGR